MAIFASAAVTWKLSHTLDKNHPAYKAIEHFAEKQKDIQNNNARIKIYPNTILGTEHQSLEFINSIALQMAKVSSAPMKSFNKSFAIFSLPYIFSNREAYYKTLLGDVGNTYYKLLLIKSL